MAWAREPRRVPLTMPHVAVGSQGPRPVMPDEPAYAELGRIDPAGHGHGSYDIVPDRPVRLSERVIRVTAGNGSIMTGPGTNTYLVGGGPSNEWAAIDPGPALAEHVEAILAAAPGPITRIFATHTHTDHSPATVALKARTGATVHGLAARHREWQDATFAPDVTLHGGERIELVPGTTLAAIHTPGHASNHLCYLLEEEKTLFTGDHVMQMSTVVINPPDGDMRAYIESLRSLLGARPRLAGAGPRLPDGRAAPGDGEGDRPPARPRGQGARGAAGAGAGDLERRCSSGSTPTCRRACTRWRCARSPPTC